MYSLEERMKAVMLFIESNLNERIVFRTLGYPSPNALRNWYKEYQQTGRLNEHRKQVVKFNEKQKEFAVNHFLENGRNLTKTSRALGYPNRNTLRIWVEKSSPNSLYVNHCKAKPEKIRCSLEEKETAVVSWLNGTADYKIAYKYDVSRATIFNWREKLLSKEPIKMKRKKTPKNSEILTDDKEKLNRDIQSLKEEIYQLKLERDVLEKAAEILKKVKGVNLKKLTNVEKTKMIGALNTTYKLKDLINFLKIAKSTYFYHREVLCNEDKYKDLRVNIKTIFNENVCCYGYRRIHAELKRNSIVVSEKVVRRIMNEEFLVAYYPKKKRKYSSYKGIISPAVANVIKRNFKAKTPNQKWLTDLTEFALPTGKVYLSPVIDCFDGIIVHWSIGTHPTAKLVNSMIDGAISKLKPGETPIIHSDMGCHYQWPDWINKVENAGLIRSMSKKGCSPDNAACEGFFGRIKNEMFYGKSWMGVSPQRFIQILDQYLHWYNYKRIKQSLGFMSPVEYRQSRGLLI